jgi:hypothetical protein
MIFVFFCYELRGEEYEAKIDGERFRGSVIEMQFIFYICNKEAVSAKETRFQPTTRRFTPDQKAQKEKKSSTIVSILYSLYISTLIEKEKYPQFIGCERD